MKIILASASPRRKALIRRLEGVRAVIVPSHIDEVSSCVDPKDYAINLAKQKALDVFKQTGGIVLGADTVVVLDGKILEKPKTIAEADEMFRKLCGRSHEVITGLCIMSEDKTVEDSETSVVTFGEYNGPLIHSYILTGAPFDKAGGYGIQDAAIRPLVLEINGDEDNVVGLPLKKVEELLKQF